MSKKKQVIKALKIKRMLNSKKVNEKPKPQEIINEQPQLDEYFKINHQLIPPYNIIIDTNFINFSIKKKLDMESEFVKCLYAGVNMHVTDCVIGELEKLGRIFKVALSIVRDTKRFKRLACDHKGTYADDCIVNRVTTHRCYLVATCDTELKQRIRKIPGVPIIYVKGHGFEVEKLPRAVIKNL